MIEVRPISSFDRPDLAPYRTMRRQEEQRQQGIFVAEGEKVVRRLLESDLRVVSVLLPPKWVPEFRELIERRADPPVVYTAEKRLLETLTGFSMYQGLLAVGEVPPPLILDQLLEPAAVPHLLAAVDGLSLAENLGTLVRNCAAFGATGLLVGETCASPYLRRAVRASMGAIFQLPTIECTHLVRCLEELRRCGVRCVAAHPHTDQRTLAQADLTGHCCLVFGGEGRGLAPAVLQACDEAVAIPMHREVDSLNVAAAAAVFLYEADRQRRR